MPAKFGSRYSGGRGDVPTTTAFGILTGTLGFSGLVLQPTGAERVTTPARSVAGSAPGTTVTVKALLVSPAAKLTVWSSRPPTKSAAVSGVAPAPAMASRTEQATAVLPERATLTA